ncbi:MAG TPA: glycerophosphodiester phosphodiesterase [Thermodesulfovibrionales bacterium]|nr:glycerophosphodiester phosphodiesterase [Thermodesulfovibrionales bacterium]
MFLKIGHRGARAYEIENTLESYERAIEMGANAIELDVRKAKDGALMVIHDDNLKRVFGSDGHVNDATAEELKELTEKSIPTLGEALHFIDGRVDRILVELKEVGYEEEVIAAIKREHVNERVIVISFHEQALLNVRKVDRNIPTGFIYVRHKKPIDTARRLKAQYLISLYRFTHARNIEDAHKHDLKVIVWTINTREEMKNYRAKGVDGIATDRPDIFDVIS